MKFHDSMVPLLPVNHCRQPSGAKSNADVRVIGYGEWLVVPALMMSYSSCYSRLLGSPQRIWETLMFHRPTSVAELIQLNANVLQLSWASRYTVSK